MVKLHLVPLKGNAASANRFPVAGVLALTPVTVEGVVRTTLDEDRKPIRARALTVSVRCYEERTSRYRATVHTNLVVDHTAVLWAKPDGVDYADVGALDCPFKLTIPRRTPGFSTNNFQDYRTFWRVEASLEVLPKPGIGSRLWKYHDLQLVRHDVPLDRHDLPLVRHDVPLDRHDVPADPAPPLPPASPLPPPPPHPLLLPLTTTKPRAPVLRYALTTPTRPVGPSDLLFASLALAPLDPGVAVRSASLTIERRIDLHAVAHPPPPPPPLSPPPPPPPFSPPSSSLSLSSLASSGSGPPTPELSPTPFPDRAPPSPSSSFATLDDALSTAPLLSLPPSPASPSPASPSPSSPSPASPSPKYAPPPSPGASPVDASRTLTAHIASADTSALAYDARTHTYSGTLTLQWPAPKSHSRWALGATQHSALASVRFFARAAVRVALPGGGADTLELAEREITVAATNAAERAQALERWTELRDAERRSKSKSPWRRERPEHDASTSTSTSASAGSGSRRAGRIGASASCSAGGKGRTSAGEGGGKPKRAGRRPHTSAGPRDKANLPYGAEEGEGEGPRRSDPERRESGLGESMLFLGEQRGEKRRKDRGESQTGSVGSEGAARKRERHGEGTASEGGGGDHVGGGERIGREQVRAWEEELARIELQSRRSSAGMLGLWGFAKRRGAVRAG